jgi:hypothetical protein
MSLSKKIWIRCKHLPSGNVFESVKTDPKDKPGLVELLENVNKMNYVSFNTKEGEIYIPSSVIQQSIFTLVEKVVSDKEGE